jgi:uncharacterized membrane protein YccC
MRDCAAICAQRRSQTPAVLQELAEQMPAALKAALSEPDVAERGEVLTLTARQLVEQTRAAIDDGVGQLAFVGLAGAAVKTAQALQAIRELMAQSQLAPAGAAAIPAPGPRAAPTAPPPQRNTLHPTAVLGIQAVVACGLAMAIAAWLNLDHPYWAFWTAFIVVAGPAGESLQKLIYRIVGVTLGSMFGSLLAVLMPDNLLLMAVLPILAMMLALYTRVISYVWLAFWTTTFVSLLYSVEGEPLRTVLVVRPLDTLIGAAIAALVVLLVMPIRVQDKFRALLVGLLKTTDAYLQAIAGGLGKPDAQAAVSAAAVQTADAYEAAAKTLRAMMLESSPFLHVQNTAAHTSVIRQLYNEVEEFARFTQDMAPEMRTEEIAHLQAMAGTIHGNIDALEQIASGQPAAIQSLQPLQWNKLQWAEAASPVAGDPLAANPPLGRRAEIALGRINQTLLQVGDSLGAAKSEHLQPTVHQ